MPNRLVVIRFPRVRVFMLEIWNRTRASNAPQCEPASKIHQEYQVSFKAESTRCGACGRALLKSTWSRIFPLESNLRSKFFALIKFYAVFALVLGALVRVVFETHDVLPIRRPVYLFKRL